MPDQILDPLYVIFEQHLYDFNDDSEEESVFIDKVVNDYPKFLHSCGSIVPAKLQKQIAEDLRDQVGEMLHKRFLGLKEGKEFVAEEKNAGPLNAVRSRSRRKEP